MILSALLAAVSLSQGAEAVSIARTFQKGEKLEYLVSSTMNTEYRQQGLETWMPSDYDLRYKFTTQVLELKPDGIVDLSYKRPTVTEVQGQTPTSGPKERTEKVNYDYVITVSPINEILNMKDVAKKPPVKKGTKDGGSLRLASPAGAQIQIPFLGQFVSEIYRLALFTGSFDSALDFSPRLPFDKVKPGDTWQRTVGYQPQKLKGKDGKSAVQRLDYTYTYKGVVTSNGKQFQRVEATLNLDSDLNDFINQTYGVTSSETGLKTIPLKLNATIEFNLDMKTHRTVYAVAKSQGGFRIVAASDPDNAVIEQKLLGSTEMKLLSATVAPVVKPGTAGAKGGGTAKRGGG